MASVDQREPTMVPSALRCGTPAVLVGLAAVGWWWSARMVSDMTSSGSTDMAGMAGMGEDALGLGAFIVAWLEGRAAHSS